MDRLLDEVWSDQGLEGKYLFEQHIATSSMAVVVAARHLELEERVAIKFLSPDALRSDTAVSRFRSEAKAAAKIKSQHVVRIIDVATTANNVPYIVMEYLDGKDLEHLLAQFPQQRAPLADAVDFILQASEAVCEGHALGIVHRDLKPANLFCIDRGDGYPLIKVLDFGISKFTNLRGAVERTDRHEILGSPRYMSPEQIESASDVDHKTDIWSLGVILYEAIAGKPPFDDDLILGLWHKIKNDSPEPIPAMRADCPTELWEVIDRCLKKDPAQRFADLGKLARAIAPFAPERSRPCVGRILWLAESNKSSTIKSSLFADSYDRVTTNPPRRRRRWLLAGGVATGVSLGLGVLVTRVVHERQPTSNAGQPERPTMHSAEAVASIEEPATVAPSSSSPIVPGVAPVPSEKPPAPGTSLAQGKPPGSSSPKKTRAGTGGSANTSEAAPSEKPLPPAVSDNVVRFPGDNESPKPAPMEPVPKRK